MTRTSSEFKQEMRTTGIIVAAGRGVRMQSRVRKQYLLLDGIPLLCHALRAFDGCPEIERIFLVIPKEDFVFCRKTLLKAISLAHPVDLIPGGRERQDSVYHALAASEGAAPLVAIHDGVRPFVLPGHISETIRCAASAGAAVLAVPAADTLKRGDETLCVKETLPREGIWIVQTPQCFRYEIIREAHEKAKQEGVYATDDAHLVEQAGFPVKLVPGSRFNFKITTSEDLALARAVQASRGLIENPSTPDAFL